MIGAEVTSDKDVDSGEQVGFCHLGYYHIGFPSTDQSYHTGRDLASGL